MAVTGRVPFPATTLRHTVMKRYNRGQEPLISGSLACTRYPATTQNLGTPKKIEFEFAGRGIPIRRRRARVQALVAMRRLRVRA